MKIILSRKGFDSAAGGCASPILPDGRLISLPIPDVDAYSDICYSVLRLNHNYSYYDLLKDLDHTIKLNKCHLDPDIYQGVLQRPAKWRGAFGQIGAAQKHLQNQGVKEGDIFLFFGWFRNTKQENGKIAFDPQDRKGRHIIFGYLQVGEIIRNNEIPIWLKQHPHAHKKRQLEPHNTIYIARKSLLWDRNKSGYGVLKYDDSLVLTKRGYNRSCWQLPECFRQAKMTYHERSNWKKNHFQSTSRGQEFVISPNRAVLGWTHKIIGNNTLI